jgi:hypothetical protein
VRVRLIYSRALKMVGAAKTGDALARTPA